MTHTNDRDAAIATIRTALRQRSGKTWSVTGGRGTSWGWIKIVAPPARCKEWGGRMSETETAELAGLLDIPRDLVSAGAGVMIPASSAHRDEYIARAAGKTPAAIAQPYWD